MNLLETTIVKAFQERVKENGDKTFVKHFRDDSWQEVSWAEYGDIVKKIACGLLELGVKRGDGICIMSGTRAEWGMVDIAILSIGCITGAIYPTLLGKDAAYIINDMKATVVFVEGGV